MNKDVSFLIPSYTPDRPINSFVQETINSINNINFDNISYEICVYSLDKVECDNVRWLQEIQKTGANNAFNKLVNFSYGNYLCMLTDYMVVLPSIVNAIKYLINNYNDKKLKILGLSPDGGRVCFPNPHTEGKGVTDYWNRCKAQNAPECDFSNIMHDCPQLPIVRYPIFSRNTLFDYMQGYCINPLYLHHWGDNWINYWAYHVHNEILIEYPEKCLITKAHDSFNHEFERDRNMFYYMIKHFKETGDKSYCPQIDTSFLKGTKWEIND